MEAEVALHPAAGAGAGADTRMWRRPASELEEDAVGAPLPFAYVPATLVSHCFPPPFSRLPLAKVVPVLVGEGECAVCAAIATAITAAPPPVCFAAVAGVKRSRETPAPLVHRPALSHGDLLLERGERRPNTCRGSVCVHRIKQWRCRKCRGCGRRCVHGSLVQKCEDCRGAGKCGARRKRWGGSCGLPGYCRHGRKNPNQCFICRKVAPGAVQRQNPSAVPAPVPEPVPAAPVAALVVTHSLAHAQTVQPL